jgi:hypothetical protein
MTPLERIKERVSRHGNVNLPATVRPILTLNEFFDGNTVDGTIGCNLDPPPSPAQFHSLLKAIAARPAVSDVLIVVTQFDDPAWPFSDTIWVITSATPEGVKGWFDPDVRPTECWEGWYPDQPTEPVEVPAGMRIVTCQWD